MKILLIQLRRLGDLILTTPAISALREHLPAAQIALAVSGECAPLLPAIQGLRQTFLTKRGVRDLSAWMEIRRAGFDCVVDFTRNDRSAWLTFLSGAPQRIVSDRLKIKSKIRLRVLQRVRRLRDETNAHGGLLSRPFATARNFRDCK
jgi:heptosyltransferase-3